jgi:uncharacterized protein (DUF697 family)
MARKKSSEILKYEANKIIKNHMIWSMGAGFIPVPFADLLGVGAVQLDLIRQLSNHYGKDFQEVQGKAIITALTGSSLARVGASAVKFIPGIGALMGGVSMAVLSAASTYALGEVFKKHFESGGTFLDFNPERLKDYYNEQFKKGQKIAKEMNEDQKEGKEPKIEEAKQSRDIVDKLKDLARLHKEGIITEKELEKAKKRLLK